MLTGRDSLNAAVMALDVASVNLNTATAKRAVGEITELEYQNGLTAIYPPRTVWRQISFSFCWPWKPMIGM